MRIINLVLFIALLPFASSGQKKILDHTAYDIWNRISGTSISDNGEFVSYQMGPENGDNELKLYSVTENKTYTFERGTRARFLGNGDYFCFLVKAQKDSIRALKRKKVKKKDLPKDTLAIYAIKEKLLKKIPNVLSFKSGEEWDSHIVYHLAPKKKDKKKTPKVEDKNNNEPDSTKQKKKIKKESETNGSRLIVRDIYSSKEDTMHYITSYALAKKGQGIAAICTGDQKHKDKVINYNFDKNAWETILDSRGKYSQLSFAENGKQLAFVGDRDTSDAQARPIELFYWKHNQSKAKVLANPKASFLPKDWYISKDESAKFSEDGKILSFDIKTPEVLQDTSLLKEEIVNVEVWNYKDGYLHTQQKVRLNDEKKRGYEVRYFVNENRFVQLEDESIKNVFTDAVSDNTTYLGVDNSPYLQNISWLGYTNYDLYKIDPKKGKKKKILSGIDGNPRVSPFGKYVYWYSKRDTSWRIYDFKKEKLRIATDNSVGNFYDETNDRPMLPRSDGSIGWSKDDENFFIYDGYDIWKVNPKKEKSAERLTKAREKKQRFRYIRLDREEEFIDVNKHIFCYQFNENSKESAYVNIDLNSGKVEELIDGPYRFGTRPRKAQDADVIVYTKENFQTFPDLYVSNDNFKSSKAISDANPQQKDYRWGDIELVEWKATDGQMLQGMIVKPENFDPNKKYPLLVNFYERSSDGLHRHRAPAAGRSSINYSFYVSRGYVIFNPDVIYTNGYPGKSCENAVLSGIEAVVAKGYIDEDRIGVQGHSWGGYQVAHLLTKTDIFKCAESGAPVVNMVSAYGGIRWGSGMSRAFQYEKTQSRLGATLWERPDLYLENSPIFNTDKVNTPVLILHNDKDGAVPWYQGIEYFVALRRLGKPAWMLNYNGEPHWPVKRQNRVDFQTRMAQFFDYYLMDAPLPEWMDKGVSAMDKGINQGLELIDNGN